MGRDARLRRRKRRCGSGAEHRAPDRPPRRSGCCRGGGAGSCLRVVDGGSAREQRPQHMDGSGDHRSGRRTRPRWGRDGAARLARDLPRASARRRRSSADLPERRERRAGAAAHGEPSPALRPGPLPRAALRGTYGGPVPGGSAADLRLGAVPARGRRRRVDAAAGGLSRHARARRRGHARDRRKHADRGRRPLACLPADRRRRDDARPAADRGRRDGNGATGARGRTAPRAQPGRRGPPPVGAPTSSITPTSRCASAAPP
jgi:hypothetical protein